MNHLILSMAALILQASTATAREDRCDRLGTAFEWEASIEAACRKARDSGKLVLALHLSGEFDDPALT